jgi:hypothetical protein
MITFRKSEALRSFEFHSGGCYDAALTGLREDLTKYTSAAPLMESKYSVQLNARPKALWRQLANNLQERTVLDVGLG